MQRFIPFLVLFLVRPASAVCQDTFSIVAVDTITGEVGSAGASCIAGSIIISDVHPGVGAIHTQSYWHSTNQNYARTLMNEGHSPEQIIDSLVAHDAQQNPTIRQYGIVDLIDHGRTAGYTGVNCFDYKNHILGPTYAIAGNILLGQQILDSMETRFVGAQGILADKLMAALQGAKVPGADTRCLASGTSSISAFIRVAQPGDTAGVLFLDLNVNSTPTGVEPIDSLQKLYNEWRGTVDVSRSDYASPEGFVLWQNYPNPFNSATIVSYKLTTVSQVHLTVFDLLGREIATLVDERLGPGTHTLQWNAVGLSSGVYLCRLSVVSTIRRDGQAGDFVETKKLVLMK
jgi:uncharacterized Ntn-hydrolase superfamily protein